MWPPLALRAAAFGGALLAVVAAGGCSPQADSGRDSNADAGAPAQLETLSGMAPVELHRAPLDPPATRAGRVTQSPFYLEWGSRRQIPAAPPTWKRGPAGPVFIETSQIPTRVVVYWFRTVDQRGRPNGRGRDWFCDFNGHEVARCSYRATDHGIQVYGDKLEAGGHILVNAGWDPPDSSQPPGEWAASWAFFLS